MVLCGSCWFLLVLGGSWWFLIVLSGSQWNFFLFLRFIVILGGSKIHSILLWHGGDS